MVFQSYALYPHMTVYENIAFPLEMAKLPKAEIAPAVQEAARKVTIDHLLDRKPGQLSGGQQQRCALARAIVRKARLFLLDEPLSNLDAKLRLETRTELKKLQRSLGVTAVYVTHDQEEAMTLADRMAVFMAGEIQQIGRPAEVFARPNSIDVAAFIGSPPMNLIPARYKRRRRRDRRPPPRDQPEGRRRARCGRRHPPRRMSGSPPAASRPASNWSRTSATPRSSISIAPAPRSAARVSDGDVPREGDGAVDHRPRRHDIHLFDATTRRRL